MTASTASPDITAAASPPRVRLGVLAQYGLLAGPLLSMLDASIVTVAVAPIARQLHAPLTLVGWAVSGYLLALGVGLAATSWRIDIGGLRLLKPRLAMLWPIRAPRQLMAAAATAGHALGRRRPRYRCAPKNSIRMGVITSGGAF
jgi:MFS family permease